MAILNFSPHKIVKEALLSLKNNEMTVITGRFGIDTERKTLSAIGQGLHLSRERIRQIEKDALKKLASKIVDNRGEYVTKLLDLFKQGGGIVRHNQIAEKFLDNKLKNDINEFNSLNLIFFLIPELRKIDKTRELEESWILSTLTKEEVLTIVNDWSAHLKKIKKPLTVDVLLKSHPTHTKYELTFLSELPHVSKKVVKTETGHIGLAAWPEINPRNVRDKIYYVLKKENKPVHFELIAKKINEQKFSKRKVVKATVHNELIADKRFVLVGRGIYALAEWGYNPGTVKEVIIDVLNHQKKGMAADMIVSEVLKRRAVKKNTILINLQTKPEFIKISKDAYALK